MNTTWRRAVHRAIAPTSAIFGIAVIFSGVIFVEHVITKYAVITLGIMVMEAGVWYMANPIFTSERKHRKLRAEFDSFVFLVRRLNSSAVASDGGDEFDRVQRAMHTAVDRMAVLAGRTDAGVARAGELAEAVAGEVVVDTDEVPTA